MASAIPFSISGFRFSISGFLPQHGVDDGNLFDSISDAEHYIVGILESSEAISHVEIEAAG